MPKATVEWMEPRSIHWLLGLCTIKGTTGVVCYVSNCILDAVHSHGPQFQNGPDLSCKVSPSEPESYADLNSGIRIKIQLRLKDKQLITQSALLRSTVCPALVSFAQEEIGHAFTIVILLNSGTMKSSMCPQQIIGTGTGSPCRTDSTLQAPARRTHTVQGSGLNTWLMGNPNPNQSPTSWVRHGQWLGHQSSQ